MQSQCICGLHHPIVCNDFLLSHPSLNEHQCGLVLIFMALMQNVPFNVTNTWCGQVGNQHRVLRSVFSISVGGNKSTVEYRLLVTNLFRGMTVFVKGGDESRCNLLTRNPQYYAFHISPQPGRYNIM